MSRNPFGPVMMYPDDAHIDKHEHDANKLTYWVRKLPNPRSEAEKVAMVKIKYYLSRLHVKFSKEDEDSIGTHK